MSGNYPILDVVEAMTIEASFLLQIQNKSPDLTAADLTHVCAYSSRAEKACKIIYAVGDNSYGIVAFTFASSAQLVTAEQSSHIRAKI